jgi:hypothetical protein
MVASHERGWMMISILALITAVIGLAQPAFRHQPAPAPQRSDDPAPMPLSRERSRPVLTVDETHCRKRVGTESG